MTWTVTAGAPAGGELAHDSLTSALRRLGLGTGQVLLLHASLRQIGRVRNGAAGVLAAFREVLGEDGTLVVPTHTADNSDTSRAHLARIAGMAPGEIRRFRAAMPPFNISTTPSTGMGAVAEQVRRTPGAVRSAHPQTSFAALGPRAPWLMSGHAADCHLGERSPLARLYDVGARVLLLGVGYEACSAFHLAEYRYTAAPPRQAYRCVVTRGGVRQWWEYEDVVLDDRSFGAIGAAFEAAGHAAAGAAGAAACRLVSLPAAVDFATEWLRKNIPSPAAHLSQTSQPPLMAR